MKIIKWSEYTDVWWHISHFNSVNDCNRQTDRQIDRNTSYNSGLKWRHVERSS